MSKYHPIFVRFASTASGTQTCVRPQYLKDKTECQIAREANRTNLGQYSPALTGYWKNRVEWTGECRMVSAG